MGNVWQSATTASGAVLSVDPALGIIRRLDLVDAGRRLTPLHAAPWLDEADIQADAALLPVERALSGDFLCAPFGASDVTDAPAHGWTANSAWAPQEAPCGELSMVLRRRVMGARVEKRQRLSASSPLLYQEHLLVGGSGAITLAHHPMVRFAGSGRFFTSPKQAVLTPEAPLEPGRNALASGIRGADVASVPGEGGGTVDLTHVPIATCHEDFVTLVEADGRRLGWSAVIRDEEDDIVFFLKDPAVLPVTMLWHSNGGRDYAPWNGRHTGVLGIEDGIAAGADGHRAALGPNPVADCGVPTALALSEGRTHRIAHVIGAIGRPPGWTEIADIRFDGGAIVLADPQGRTRELDVDAGFFARAR